MRPDKFTYTLILSSPASFPGEIESKHFLLTHAWPDFNSGDHEMDPNSRYSRNFFALTFREEELSAEKEKASQLPHYGFVGDYFSVFLSLYFGKRFDNLGFHLDHGLYRLPNLQAVRPRKHGQAPPFSPAPRKDLSIPLRLDQAASLVPILEKIFAVVKRDITNDSSLHRDLELAFTAGRFYQQGLQLYDTDPEFAFLSLVNAGEVLARGLQFKEDELYDEELKRLLIEIGAKAGQPTVDKIKRRLFQVKRKFTRGLASLLNSAFFAGSEAIQEFLSLKPEKIETHLNAAYDLRSRFLHVGTRFGGWVSSNYEGSEIMVGESAYGDSEWKKIISRIPTLGGLERIIRFCVLRFIHQRISTLHPLLD